MSNLHLTGLKSRHQQGWLLLDVHGEALVPNVFQFLQVASIPWLVVLFHLQSQQWSVVSFLQCITLILTLLPLSCTFKEPL